MTEESNPHLGIVVSGSLTKGIEVRLDSSASIEEMAVGRYVTIQGEKRRFFGMITDISLGVTDERITLSPPDVSDRFTAEVLAGTSTFGTLHVLPMLTIGGADGPHGRSLCRIPRCIGPGERGASPFLDVNAQVLLVPSSQCDRVLRVEEDSSDTCDSLHLSLRSAAKLSVLRLRRLTPA